MPAKKATTTTKPEAIQRKFTGVVVSSKSDKTIIVEVSSVKVHPKYKKRYTVKSRYQVHDEQNEYRDGDQVTFIQCRPLSKEKRWRVIKVK
ncbi:MAG: 30S ribosomal protein S17 [Patescibacteria group bacterium]|jgi:small subunit ribosomal protein S17